MAAEETNTVNANAKWEALQEMRRKRDGDPPVAAAPAAPEPPPAAPATPVEVTLPVETPPVVAAPKETPATPPAPVVDDAAPRSVEIELDGQRVNVAPDIAEAFTRAEGLKKDSAKSAERDALKAEILAEVTASLPPPPPPKTEAELAAERALAEASKVQMPDGKLAISDPEEHNRQMKLYIDQQKQDAKAEAKAEIAAESARQQVSMRATQEEQARAVLREQFYTAYPTFRGSEDLVNGMLKDKFDEVVASGKLNKPLTPKEREELKASAFADVVTKATKQIVALMNQGKKIAPPPAPPTLASSAPTKAPAQEKTEEPRKAKEKYPKGSISAMMAERRAARETARA